MNRGLMSFMPGKYQKTVYTNILFVIPHTQGHSPLWYLILKCFSFFNVNCELGIKIPNLLFMFGAVWLLIFKSPFPRMVRLTLPFTYFIFYQYSVISRPYSIFCFAIFLAAVFYKERNNHPFKFVFALALLCLSSAYGMVISAGIILVLFIELIQSNQIIFPHNRDFNKDVIAGAGSPRQFLIYKFIKDKRFYAMSLIFLLSLLLFVIMYPDSEGTSTISGTTQPSFLSKLLYAVFIFPSDSLITNWYNYSVEKSSPMYFTDCIWGFIINILFFFIFKFYGNLRLFFIPYIMLFCSVLFVYSHVHHVGLLFIFCLFALWCAIEEPLNKKTDTKTKFQKILILFFSIVITVQLYWSITACINEIKYSYSSGREIAEYIKKNKIENCKIMAQWAQINYIDSSLKERKLINFNYQFAAAVVIPYFSKNIIYSYNINHPDKGYVIFKNMYEDEITDIKSKLKKEGLPDIIINRAELYEIFDEKELSNVDYVLLKQFPCYMIWKDKYDESYNEIFMRKDLYDKLYNIENVNY